MMLRRIFSLTLLLLLPLRAEEPANPATAKAEMPPVLMDAITKLSKDTDRWAYTETRIAKDPKGVSKGETVIRFDPSKPYAEQYVPLKIDGKPPTERQLADYRRRGVKRGERLDREAGLPAPPVAPAREPPSFRIGSSKSFADVERITIAQENENTITYHVPLRPDPKIPVPMEKIELLVRVNKAQRTLENVSVRVLDSFRVKLVVKINSGGANIDFKTVDPKFAPVVSAISGDAAVSILFVKFGGAYDLKREDFKRVKPYGDRFEVRIGELRTIDF